MSDLHYNKVCNLEDFADQELTDIIRDVFRHEMPADVPQSPRGYEYRKHWEIAMAVRALRHYGALRPDSLILGVGAGTEPTVFYLANHARQVFATDLYLAPGSWSGNAPHDMMRAPEQLAPYGFDRRRLVVQHMSGTRLEYPDDTFDGIFSSGSIEHFGSFTDIARAAYEMGRVLKPGGVLTLSTEFRIRGRASGVGLYGLKLFSPADLHEYIVKPSGLELVDQIDTELSPSTLASMQPVGYFTRRHPPPHLVLKQRGYVFCSVHLALRKTASYPAADNQWADPRASTPQDAAQTTTGSPGAPPSLVTRLFWMAALNVEDTLREHPIRTGLPLAIAGGIGAAAYRAARRSRARTTTENGT